MMAKWPLLISVPHGGLDCPDELASFNLLSKTQIMKDGDEFANPIYRPLKEKVALFHAPEIARAFIDLNRPVDDLSQDGVFKTHTCFMEPIYSQAIPDQLIGEVLEKYYLPYHQTLSNGAQGDIKLGIDCHTMLETAPPISYQQGQIRPDICISMIDHSCPMQWVVKLQECFQRYVEDVRINDPFKGGYITKVHGREMPWLQLEWNRSIKKYSTEKKADTTMLVMEKLLTQL